MNVLIERAKWKEYIHSINDKAYKLNSIRLKMCSMKCLKEYTKKKINESNILNQIKKRANKRLVVCSLKHWVKKTMSFVKKRKQSELSIRLSRQKHLRTYLNRWHTLFLHKSTRERQEQEAQLLYRKKMVNRALIGWKEWFNNHNWKKRYSSITI